MMEMYVDCPACGTGEAHLDGCPLADEIPAIPDKFELNPIGTRDRLDRLGLENEQLRTAKHEMGNKVQNMIAEAVLPFVEQNKALQAELAAALSELERYLAGESDD